MSEQTPAVQKLCTKCGESKNASLEFFHADPRASDKLYPQCKVCRKQKRTEALTPVEKKQLDRLDRREAAFNADLDNPNATANALRTAEIGVRKTIPKQRAELQKQIDERLRGVRLAELAKRQQIQLENVRTEFPIPEVLPVGEEREDAIYILEQKRNALRGEEFESAQGYLNSQVASLKNAIEREKQEEAARIEEMEQTQEDIEQAASDAAAHEILDWAKPLLLEPLTLNQRENMRALCLSLAEKSKSVAIKKVADRMVGVYKMLARRLEVIDQDNIKTFPEEFYTQGHSTAPTNWNFRTSQEKALLRYFTIRCIGEKWAHTLPDAPEPIWYEKPPADSLSNIQSRLDDAIATAPQLEEQEARRQKYWEELKRTDLKRYEKESTEAILQVKGSDIWAQRSREGWKRLKENDPDEYRRQSLQALEPQNYELPTLIYLVPVWTHANPNLPSEMRWPDGTIVQPHEVTYDYRLKKWFLPAEPISVELNFEKQETGRPTPAQMAKLSPEAQEFWCDEKAANGVSDLFSKPTPITFRKGDRHVAGSGRDVFRHGHFWTEEEVRRAESGWVEKPSSLLPPLPAIMVADSFATKPESAEAKETLNAEPYCWKRLEQQRKEDQENEERLLN